MKSFNLFLFSGIVSLGVLLVALPPAEAKPFRTFTATNNTPFGTFTSTVTPITTPFPARSTSFTTSSSFNSSVTPNSTSFFPARSTSFTTNSTFNSSVTPNTTSFFPARSTSATSSSTFSSSVTPSTRTTPFVTTTFTPNTSAILASHPFPSSLAIPPTISQLGRIYATQNQGYNPTALLNFSKANPYYTLTNVNNPFGGSFGTGSLGLLNPLTNPFSLSAYGSMSAYGGFQSPLMMSGLGGGGFGGGYGGGGYGGGYGGGGYQSPPPVQPQVQQAAAPAETMTTTTIAINDDSYQATSITIAAGTAVQWKNTGRRLHTVTSDTGLWDSQQMDPGRSVTVFFAQPGTYFYHDTLHPDTMRASVIVQ